jgi:hypothetical protein
MTLLDSCPVSLYNYYYGLWSGEDAEAQSFNSGGGGTLTSVKFYLRKAGAPAGNLTAKLYAHTGTFANNSGEPTGAALATSDAMLATGLTTSFALTEFTFSGAEQYVFTADTAYCVSIEGQVGNAGNHVDVGLVDHGVGPYTPSAGNEAYRTNPAGAWVGELEYDVIFYLYGSTDSANTGRRRYSNKSLATTTLNVSVKDGYLQSVIVNDPTDSGGIYIFDTASDFTAAQLKTWAEESGYDEGDAIAPGNGFVYRCIASGSTAPGDPPTWPTTIGETVVDNDIIWQCEEPLRIIANVAIADTVPEKELAYNCQLDYGLKIIPLGINDLTIIYD